MQLTGIHHVTAITADAPGNHVFYTDTLGLRLVKKTVNQDDTSAYHLFYADGRASPGSDLTFFDWPAAPERRGTKAVVLTSLRVAGRETLAWWAERFAQRGIRHGGITRRENRDVLVFEDPEGQRLMLVNDEGRGQTQSWERSTVPVEHQVRGLGFPLISVPDITPTDAALTQIFMMRQSRRYADPANGAPVHVYAMGDGDRPECEVHVRVDAALMVATQGAGAVHHIAFRTPDQASYTAWSEHLRRFRLPSSGPVDRFYFQSLYMREPNGILIEIATDGPGFATDESWETLGERLALPPFLESRRAAIEGGLTPLHTPAARR